MSYFVYRVTPAGPVCRLERLACFEAFKEASAEAKRLRRESDLQPGETIRTVFAADELHAEDLLANPGEAAPMTGEDW